MMAPRAVKTHACVVCASRLLFSFSNNPRKGWCHQVGKYGHQTYLFNLHYDEAIAQAKRGCHLMKWLVALPTGGGGQLRAALSNVGVTQIYFEWVNDAKDPVLGGAQALTLCADEMNAAATEVLCRQPNLYPSSPATMAQIQMWLQNCVANHKECSRSPSSDVFPKRLLEISANHPVPTLRVAVCSSTSRFPYVALSYCWGGPQQVKLEKENCTSLSEELEYELLPQTIKDAVKVTLHLGLRHLWVDAFCIVQDDPLDKLSEISKMSEIYKLALVTISAARAARAEDGFLQPRNLSEEEGEEEIFEIPFMCQNGRLGHVLLYRSSRNVGWHEPIDNRGWTLQESLMSPRLLEFGKHQVRWRCRSNDLPHEITDGWTPTKIGESELDIDWDDRHEQRLLHHNATEYNVSVSQGIDPAWRVKRGLNRLLQRSSGRRIRLGISGANFITTWEDVIENYTNRELSNPQDRLAAISSIARELQHVSGHEYVAGLWRHAIPRLLLWRVHKTGKRPPKYTAPSWSWASVIGAIKFQGFDSVDLKMANVKLLTLMHSDLFSEITSGVLQIQGMVSEVMIRRYKEQNPIIAYHRVSFWEPIPGGGPLMGDGYLDLQADDMDEEIWNERLLLLLVAQVQFSGLILRRARGGRYCRVGYFDGNTSDRNLTPAPEPFWTDTIIEIE